MATGRVYVFSGSQAVQTVDERDVAALLQTRYFRRAYRIRPRDSTAGRLWSVRVS